MSRLDVSAKGKQLLKMYRQMAEEGYDRTDGERVVDAFSDFGLSAYRPQIRQIIDQYSVSTVLDYGCGGSDWNTPEFDDSGQSALEFFNLQNAYRYEPARQLDERQQVDCVISFDVLEHIFISDVPAVLRNMFSYAGKLLVLNVACYPAVAKLSNGENAHVTVRKPAWWKGMLDCISVEYPDVTVFLICSIGWHNSSMFPAWTANEWQESSTFVVNQVF